MSNVTIGKGKVSTFKPIVVSIECNTQAEVNALYILGNFESNVVSLLAEKQRCSVGKVDEVALACILNQVYISLQNHRCKE